MQNVTASLLDRAAGCLRGIATGDAVGKQTENCSREDVRRWYPDGVRGFEGTPGTTIPRYVGNSKREWLIGETTDDTERTLAVARAIIADGTVSRVSVARELLRCVKCVHPGLKSLWEFHQAGDPSRVARTHDGCGAAVRVAPVGIVYSSERLEALVLGAWEASVPTHGGILAIAAAAATAAAVTAALDAATPAEMLQHAEEAAHEAQRRWPDPAAPIFADAIRTAYDSLSSLRTLTAKNIAGRCFPNQPLTIVPLALALSALTSSAEDAILLAANVGGDSDSVASIAGGILGATYPDTINEEWCREVERVNRHELVPMADALVRLRNRAR